MKKKLLGIVTCSKLPASAAEDDLLARALEARGFETHAIVWDLPNQWRGMDALVFRSVWNYHHHIDRFDAWLDEIETSGIRTINSLALMRWNARKTYLLDLQLAGVPTVETILVENTHALNLKQIAEEHGWPTIILKPIVGASAHGVSRIDLRLADDHGAAGCTCRREGGLESAPPFLLQPYLEEIETEGEWSLIFFAGVYSHAVRKRPGQGDFRVQVEHGGHSLSESPPEPVLQAAQTTIAALPELPTYARIDLVETVQGPKVMEVELIEPELFLGHHPSAPAQFACALERCGAEKQNE